MYESEVMRTFIHVHDIARSWLFAIDNLDRMENTIFNVGSNSLNYSKRDVCEVINDKTGAYFHYADIGEDPDKRNYVISYDRINNAGFETTITLEEGIDELIKASSAAVFQTPFTNI